MYKFELKLFLIACLFFSCLTLVPMSFAHTQTVIIEMTTDGFIPDPASVDENSTVIFLNKDTRSRWPASNVHPTHEIYPEFDSRKPVKPGESWAFKLKKVGDFKYHDHLFPHIRGTLVVAREEQSTGAAVTTWFDELFKKVKNFFSTHRKESTKSTFSKEAFLKTPSEDQMKTLKEVAESESAEKAWGYVKLVFKGVSGSTGNIHDLAHLSGSLLFKEGGFNFLVKCSPDFAFGCYHGFLDEAFRNNLDHLSEAEEACLKLGKANTGPVASCIHGIGHGVASFYSVKDLRKSLSTCRRLTSGKEYCFDGVFMEFVRSAPENFFRKDDPLYPCSNLEKEFGYAYSSACGRNQPSLLLSRFNVGFDQVVSVCLSSDSTPFRESCIDSLGFSLASSGDSEKIIQGCQMIDDAEYIKRCIQAAAGELVFQEVPGWREKSKTVCGSNLESQDQCLQYINRLILDYQRN